MPIANKIIKNVGANTAGKLFDIVALAIITPLTLRYLGSQLYGLWSIIFVLSGYITFVDFGIGQSYVKFIAEHHAKGNYSTINKIINTGLFFYLFIALALTAIVYIKIDFIVSNLFKIPFEHIAVAKISIVLAFAVMCLFNAFSCFSGLLNGMQRMELSNGIKILTRIISLIGVVLVIYNDWGIFGLTINASIRLLVTVGLWVFAGIKIFPQLRISVRLISKSIFKLLFNYGYKLQVVLIGALILRSVPQMLLSNILGLSYVAYYTIGLRIAEIVRMFPGFLFSAVVPAISDLNARMKKDVIRKIYYKGSKYVSFFTAWIVFSSSTIIPYLFYLWLGLRNPEVNYTFYIMTFIMAIHVALVGIASSILRGVGIVKYEMHAAIIRICIILSLGAIFTRTFGFVGLLLLMLATHIISGTYFCLKFNQLNKTPPLFLFRKVTALPFLLGLTLFGIFKWIISACGLVSMDKMVNLIYLLTFGVIFSLIYFGLAFLLRYFNQDEINYIKHAKMIKKIQIE